MVGSGWRIAAIVFIVTVLKWESYNSQVVMKYGGITLVGLLVGWIMGDPITGLIVGGTMELMQVGLLGVVGSSVPDYQIGACVGGSLSDYLWQGFGYGVGGRGACGDSERQF